MSTNEDAVPKTYTYAWSAESDLPLPDFLKKYKPSMVQNDGTKPWIWVRGGAPTREDTGEAEALEEGKELLKVVSERVEEIKNDASIPARSSKKTGAKGKKEVREEYQAEATAKFKDIAMKHGFVSGKWLVFAPPDKVDVIWSSLATSLVSGPLAETSAYLAKVATSPADGSSSSQHLICIYMPDVYDKPAVTEVMKVLLRNHGMNLSGVKSNLYTALGIDSKHPSGLQSTTWKNAALLPDSESKELKDAYFAELTAAKAAPKPAVDADKPADAAKAKAKPQPKKKQAADDPFGSDDEDGDEEAERKAEIKSKKAPPKKAAKRAKDSSAEEEEEEERPKKKKAAAKK
ncbi:hypothetical protein C8R43DRAFT_1045968 [Mycena crocata]|nr:hypothetical protein C8R43DRAFT_1045968 [Mycena crocata]